MEEENKNKGTDSLWSCCYKNRNSRMSPKEDGLASSNARAMGEKPGWKAIPYILGNEIFEKMATLGIIVNLMVYLSQAFNLGQVDAVNIISIFTGVNNCIPIIGAFVADASLGKFRTIAISSFGLLVGIVIVSLTSWVPQFHPPSCTTQQKVCDHHPKGTHLAILIFGLCWLAIGIGGIKPCTVAFAIDQFDTTSPEGRKGVNSYFNWHYTAETLVFLISNTLMVYFMSKSWVVGFGTLCALMVCAIIILFCGTKVYHFIPAEGSILSGIAQVFVAAYKKYHLQDPENEEQGVYYDPPLKDDKALKMPVSKEFKCLNKAALIQDNELNAEGRATNPWRLCSIQQVEEVKCLIKMIPIWASGILCMIPVTQQLTFPVSQASKMDRQLGPHFKIPAPSFNAVSMITVATWLPCYDLFLQQMLAKVTKREEGLTSLQKLVVGNIFSVLTMLSAGLVERKRRGHANSHASSAPMSAMWLAPQYVLLGFCEIFTIIGHIQFYNSESPEKMRSVGNSLVFLMVACSNFAGSLVVNTVHKVTKNATDWLNNDLNAGRLEYYYFLIAGLAAINLVYLLFCVKRYRYKVIAKSEAMDTP